MAEINDSIKDLKDADMVILNLCSREHMDLEKQ